jgi:hypothetical protein
VTLHALLLAAAELLSVPATSSRAGALDAIEFATKDPREAVLMLVVAKAESDVQEHPRPQSWDARAGKANGLWQLWGPDGLKSPREQAVAWLALYHDGVRVCPASPLAPLSGGCLVPAARRLGERRERQAEQLQAAAELDVALRTGGTP